VQPLARLRVQTYIDIPLHYYLNEPFVVQLCVSQVEKVNLSFPFQKYLLFSRKTMATIRYNLALLLMALVTQSLAPCSGDITQSHTSNATRSTSITGISPPGMNSSTWTLHVQVENYQNYTAKQSYTSRELWLSIDPAQNLSSPDLTWEGCSLIFQPQTPGKAAGTSNGCDGHISTACQQALSEQALSIPKIMLDRSLAKPPILVKIHSAIPLIYLPACGNTSDVWVNEKFPRKLSISTSSPLPPSSRPQPTFPH
jgi:hypothetical protein